MADTPARETLPDGTFIVDHPVSVPEVLDVLIVGGGPFGTAAAFRAKELGLRALVIDHDDLMRRIRDYAKGKEILPDYGGGDRMQFPDGGPLIRGLWFEPIDKDAMCVRWKSLYRQHSVPAQVGVEMLGVEKNGALWNVKCWNHNTKADQIYKAKHVVLAMGRGVPRRIDIAGDLRGMAFSFKDASSYLGQPALVIGGGTSAAEAVIAISNAKVSAAENAAVYWSYRADKMPKVSKALAEVFFDAFVINGNVRYLPSSEPVGIVGEGPQARLAIRTVRKETPGQPVETTHLEFDKTFCVACIGEDIPEQLLTAVGAPLVTGGPQNKKRIIVTPILETRQPNMYLAGDVLSPAYFETTNFDGDPAGFSEVKRRGNVKAAMRDGVFVAEVIAQKLAGKSEIRVDLKFADAPVSQVAAATGEIATGPAVLAPAPSAAEVAAVVQKGDHLLVSILPTGVEANEFSVKPKGTTTIGRAADVSFPDDGALADRHAAVEASPDGYWARPEPGARGLYLQPPPGRIVPLEPGMLIHAGRQWFVSGDRHDPASLIHYEASGQAGQRYTLQEGPTIVGRESPDLSVAPTDAALSRRHFAIIRKGTALAIKDLGSANGTLIQIDRPVLLAQGDCLVLGQQKLKFADEREAERPKATVQFDASKLRDLAHAVTGVVQVPLTPRPAASPAPAAAPARPAAAAAPAPAAAAPVPAPVAAPAPVSGEPSVTVKATGKTATCAKGKLIWECLKEGAKVDLAAGGCHQGECGMDPVKILSGADSLSPMSDVEKGTLEDLCSLKPGEHRLACMARVSGPVVIEPIKQ